MNKAAFLEALRPRLKGLSEEDIMNSLDYYSEMIDERIEDGLTEEEAVAAVGSVEQAAAQILSEIPLKRIIKQRFQRSRALTGLEIALIVLGSPLWLSLLFAAFMLLLGVVIAVFAVVVSIFAVHLALLISAVAVVVGGVVLIFMRGVLPALMMVGAGLAAAGLGLLLWPVIRLAAKAAVKFCKKLMLIVKEAFI